MKTFRNLAIQQKMLAITLMICGAVLFLGIVALFVFQVVNFRARFQTDTTTLATIIANNSTAAIEFKDANMGAEVIGALQAKPTVVAATLLLPDGQTLAAFGKPETADSKAEFPAGGGSRFTDGELLVTTPIMLKGEQIGALHLRSNYRRTFWELLGMYALVVFGVVCASILLALFLSGQLGRRITGPILELARTAQLIGEKKDYSLRAALPDDRDEVARLTQSFNEMLSRIETQDAALSLSQQKMEALINSIDGIVWEREPETFRFTFVSRQAESILGYAPDAWLAEAGLWEAKLHPQDAAKTSKAARDFAASGQPYTHEYRMLAADGRTVWIRESGTVLSENGRPVALRGIFQDVTRQKADSEQLDKLNRQLMSTSRLAGMAEVATGVLHNVGNVLNSLSVSATLVADGLRNSKAPNLQRAASMMRGKNGELARYLTEDPKGKLLPDYLATVADQIAGEHARLGTQMASVGTHIEHIKEIVAMQQSYAKVSGVYENLEVRELVEDALRMNAAAFDRHGIDLTREFADELPMVCVDRHKVLQILINLLRNAKYAMDQRGETDKRLVVRVAAPTAGLVRISVIDNGVGIVPENLNKIFNHGFTTKKDGHGFGLHSGANAAKEMGGTLTAHSEGLGKGAEFVLELPTTAARPQKTPASI
ncbi:MAG TPA: PAS domain-containing protein [Verrucomicrobiae bacterium]|nr:PAS domain-containing protein [Verrucomicrobiae bacterium]